MVYPNMMRGYYSYIRERIRSGFLGRRSIRGIGLLLIVAVLGLGASGGGAAVSSTATFTAVADAYVIGGTSNQNHGTASTLRVKPSSPTETAYLKFNVSGLSGAVQSATLRVNALSGLNWGFDAYTTSSSWTETALTYQNAPARATKLGSFPSGNLTGWISLDVTPAITADGTYSFALVGTYWQEISLSAREAGATAPQLVITTNGTPPPPDTQAPTTPNNLTITNTTPSSLTLSWSTSTDNTAVTGYNLYRGAVKAGTASAPSYTYTGLSCGSSYTLGVEAYDAAGNVSSRSTLDASTAACPDTQPPTAPTTLVQTGSSSSSVSLSWDAATDNVGVAGYGLYVGGSARGSAAATTATISSLACGTSYQIGVDAYDAAGNRSAQTAAIATTAACAPDTQAPSAPSNLAITSSTGSSLTLSWSASTDNVAVSGYNLYRDAVTAGTASSPSYTYSGLNCGSSYTLAVEAFDAAGNISGRPTLTASTAPCGPSSATFTAVADAYVVGGTSNQNHGTASTLRVKPSSPTETSYLKFNVSGLSGAVQSATLRVNALSGLNWGFDAYTTSSSWTETALTYQNAPARATKLGSFPSGNLTGWISLDVTPAITADGTYSFALVGTYWQEISLSAREAGATAPQLVITTNGTPPPPDTQAPTTPNNLTITNTTPSSLTLSWSTSTDNTAVTGYNLYRATTTGFTPSPSNRIAQPTTAGYTDAGLAGGTYHYRVTARDAAGNESLASAEATATVAGGGVSVPTPVPAANLPGVTVGPGFVEASARQLLRTSGGTVYVITADDSPCQTGGSGVIRAWKGTGAQAGNANVPTGFAEQDSAGHPISTGRGSCIYAGGVGSVLLSPDSRLDAAGTIHLAYIDGSSGGVYYQTFSTATDRWGPRTTIATGAQTSSGSGWPRGGQVALTLDAADAPHVLYATSGTANSLRYTGRAGGSWSTPVVVATGTNIMHPSLATSLDGVLHAAWLDNSLAAHAAIKYARYASGSWSAPETVSSGDAVVLNNTDDDQGPSVATDPSNRPHVLYMDGTANGSNDYVRMRYRTSGGSWNDNTPPGGAGGASNPAGTWYAHTPQNYVSAAGDDFVFLGHDSSISPGGYQYQLGGPGGSWSAYARLDPRDQSNTTAGAPGLDGSASIRFIRSGTRTPASSTSSTTTRTTARPATTTTPRSTTRRSSFDNPRRLPASTSSRCRRERRRS